MSSSMTVNLITPGYFPRKQGAKAENKGLACPPMPAAGDGASGKITGLNPFLLSSLESFWKAFLPIRSWLAPGSTMAHPAGMVR